MQRDRFGQDAPIRLSVDRRTAVQWFTKHVEQTTQTRERNRNPHREAGVIDGQTAPQSGRAMQRDCTRMTFIDVLMNLKHVPIVIKRRIDRLMERWDTTAREVNYRPVDLLNDANRRIVGLNRRVVTLDIAHEMAPFLSLSHFPIGAGKISVQKPATI